jgi:hypothetical protein
VQAWLDTVTRPLRRTVVKGGDGTVQGVVGPEGTFTPDRNDVLSSGRRRLQACVTSREEAHSVLEDRVARELRPAGGTDGFAETARLEKNGDSWSLSPGLEIRQSGVVGGFALACRAIGLDPLRFLREGRAPADVESPSRKRSKLVLLATCTNAGSVDLQDVPEAVAERVASVAFSTFCQTHVPVTPSAFARKSDEVTTDG